MTNNQGSGDDELDRVLDMFDGGIHGKGSERGGYPTYFDAPYPIWLTRRKRTAKERLKALIEQSKAKAVEEADRNARIDENISYLKLIKTGNLGHRLYGDLIRMEKRINHRIATLKKENTDNE